MVTYSRILAEHGIIHSMSRKRIVDAVRDYLDYYNHRRIQLKSKGLSPIQYRKQSFK